MELGAWTMSNENEVFLMLPDRLMLGTTAATFHVKSIHLPVSLWNSSFNVFGCGRFMWAASTLTVFRRRIEGEQKSPNDPCVIPSNLISVGNLQRKRVRELTAGLLATATHR